MKRYSLKNTMDIRFIGNFTLMIFHFADLL